MRRNAESIRNDSDLDIIIPIGGLRELPGLLAQHGYSQIKKLGMELDVLPVGLYLRYLDIIKPSEILNMWPSIFKMSGPLNLTTR